MPHLDSPRSWLVANLLAATLAGCGPVDVTHSPEHGFAAATGHCYALKHGGHLYANGGPGTILFLISKRPVSAGEIVPATTADYDAAIAGHVLAIPVAPGTRLRVDHIDFDWWAFDGGHYSATGRFVSGPLAGRRVFVEEFVYSGGGYGPPGVTVPNQNDFVVCPE